MTPEEATQLYNSEQRKYYDYCGYIQSYENKIAEYRFEYQNKCVLADDKKNEIQRNQDLFDSISNTTTARDGLFSHLTQINTKVEEAATNFRTMVSSNTVNAFNLGDSFGENATGANSNLTEVFDLIGTGKSTISGIIDGLNQELQALNSRIQELETEISRAQGMIDHYESSKQTCVVNMAYYKKFMTT